MSTATTAEERSLREQAAREARRRARASWPMRRYELGSEPAVSMEIGSASERLASVWPLTLLSWRLAGRDIPSYERSASPGRILRPIGAE